MTEQTPPPAAPEPVEPAAPAAEATVQAPPPAPPVAPSPAKSGRAKKIARSVGIPVAVLLAVGGYQAYKQADRNEDGTVTSKGDVSAFQLRVKDCLNLPNAAKSEEGGMVDTITAVPCGEAHDAEVFAAKDLDNPKFPGEARVDAFADRYCDRQFRAYVGVGYNQSTLEFSKLTPTAASWAQEDRSVTCIVYDPKAKTTGSLKGVRR